MHSMFYMCADLEEIIGIEDIDISGLRDCSWMFAGCPNLKNLDLSMWDISYINALDGMFSGCSSLTDISWVNDWQFSENMTDLSFLFNNCKNITELNLSNWNVENIKHFDEMFRFCENLTTVGDISDWNLEKAGYMEKMFLKCKSLTNMGDLNKWDKYLYSKNNYCVDCTQMFVGVNDKLIPSWYNANNNNIIM